jgi:hypothetical protein
MRGWVCILKLLLRFASTVIIGPEAHAIHDHILLSQIWKSPDLEGQIAMYMAPRNRATQ